MQWAAVWLVWGALVALILSAWLAPGPVNAGELGDLSGSPDHLGRIPPVDVFESLRRAVRTLGTDRAYFFYELEYYSLPIYREFHLTYGTYHTPLFTARDAKGIQRDLDRLQRTQALIVLRASDLEGHAPDPVTTGSLRSWLDVLSGAHGHGSALAATLVTSRAHLAAPFFQRLRDAYQVVYAQDGLLGFAPRQVPL